jgi:hypothetical protein
MAESVETFYIVSRYAAWPLIALMNELQLLPLGSKCLRRLRVG